MKESQKVVCGLQNIDLTNDTIKILGIHFSYNKKIQGSMNYKGNYSRGKCFNFYNTGNIQDYLFIFEYNCPEFDIGRNSENSENIFMALF